MARKKKRRTETAIVLEKHELLRHKQMRATELREGMRILELRWRYECKDAARAEELFRKARILTDALDRYEQEIANLYIELEGTDDALA